MKAISIIALVFAGLAIFIPVAGVLIALFCSLMVLISFRTEPTISGIAFGINILNTAFLSPSLMITDIVSSSADGATNEPGDLYFFYIGFHVALLVAAIIWRLIRGPVEPKVILMKMTE